MIKKLFLIFGFLIFGVNANATSISMPFCSESTGGYILASHWNSNCSTIGTWANNNNIDSTTNIATGGVSTAAIANLAVTDGKIAGITTSGKVNGSALTALNNIPSGASTVPSKNGGTNADMSAAAQGAVPYFSATGTMSALGVGTAGQVLQSQGVAANPQWAFPSGQLGSWASKSADTTIGPTATDGFLVAWGVSTGADGSVQLNTDSSNPPATNRCTSHINAASAENNEACSTLVKKGDYYKEISGNLGSITVYFIPIGS